MALPSEPVVGVPCLRFPVKILFPAGKIQSTENREDRHPGHTPRPFNFLFLTEFSSSYQDNSSTGRIFAVLYILLFYSGEIMIRNLKRVSALFLGCSLLIWASAVVAGDRVAKDGDTVSIHYTGSLEDKTVFDTSKNREPLVFILGEKYIIPGMNNAIRGMKAGESKTVSIPSKDAYGPYNDKLVFEVPTKNLPAGVTAGTPLRDPQGNMVLVKDIKGDKSVLDANHILAGKTLIFDIKLLSISDVPPTPSPHRTAPPVPAK